MHLGTSGATADPPTGSHSDKPETVDLAFIGRLVAAFEATTTSLCERAASVEERADRAENPGGLGRYSCRSG